MSQDAGRPAPPPGVTLRAVARGHEGIIDDLAWSPDGGLLATASRDGTARLWRPADGAEVAVLPPGGHGREVTCVAFSPDAELLATVAGDGTVRLWALPGGTLEAVLRAPSPYCVHRVRWSQDGRRLVGPAGVPHEGFHFVWDRAGVGGDQPLRRPSSSSTTPSALSPDGTTLADAPGGDVRLRDVARGRVVRTLSGHTGRVFGLAWSPDGMLLASQSVDGTVRLWDTARGHEVTRLAEPYPPVGSVRWPGEPRPVFHPFRADLLATVADDADQAVTVWQLDSALLPVDPRRRLGRLLRSRQRGSASPALGRRRGRDVRVTPRGRGPAVSAPSRRSGSPCRQETL